MMRDLEGIKRAYGYGCGLDVNTYPHWLISRVQELEDQNKLYREALEFYSKESNYSGYLTAGGWVKTPINDDNGETARQALKGGPE